MVAAFFWVQIQSSNFHTKCRKLGSIPQQKHNFSGAIIFKCCCIKVTRGINLPWALADLGGVRPARAPPLRVQILSFWHAKFSKHSRLGDPRPPVRGPRPPLREILDPPLLGYRFPCTPVYFCPLEFPAKLPAGVSAIVLLQSSDHQIWEFSTVRGTWLCA